MIGDDHDAVGRSSGSNGSSQGGHDTVVIPGRKSELKRD
jgi:hypothetical protein